MKQQELVKYLEAGINHCSIQLSKTGIVGKTLLTGRKLAFREILREVNKEGELKK